MPHLKFMVAIFLTSMLWYLFFWSGHHYSIDGIVIFQYAKSLLFHGSFTMNPPVRWGIDFTVSKWPIGLTLLYIPVLTILSSTVFKGNNIIKQIPFDPTVDYNFILLDNRLYRYSSFVNPVITATTAALLYLFCLQFGLSKKRAWAVALIFGIASPAAVYAKFDFAQPLASLFILIAMIFLIRVRNHGRTNLVIAGISLGLAILTRPEVVIFPGVAFITTAYLIQPAQPGTNNLFNTQSFLNVLMFIVPMIGFVFLNQYINALRFGGWFSTGYTTSGGDKFIFGIGRITKSLLGHLISPGRGLLIFFPLSFLSLIGCLTLIKRDRLVGFLLVTTIFGSLLLYSSWLQWAAGISWGPRFLIPIIPYLTVLAFVGYDTLHRLPNSLRISLLGVLIALGLLTSLQGLLFNPLEFYSILNLSGPDVVQGDYNFLLNNSPIIMGWKDLFHPLRYDIFWLQNLQKVSDKWYFIMFGCSFLLGFSVKFWIDYFVSANYKKTHVGE